MRDGVRYQYYESSNGHILFMASERKFWKNFCEGVERLDLFERWPGEPFGDHAVGNRELQCILRDVFKARLTEQWMAFSSRHNTAIAPVNSPKTLLEDPHFQHRFRWSKMNRNIKLNSMTGHC